MFGGRVASRALRRVVARRECSLTQPYSTSVVMRHKAPTPAAPTSEFPLQSVDSKEAPPAVGYNLVLQRVANMVLNVTDKQTAAKLLHVFPENAFVSYVGKITNVDICGFSNAHGKEKEFRDKSKYSAIEYVPSFYELPSLPHRSNTFDIVLHCLPVLRLPEEDASTEDHTKRETLLSPPALPFGELLRVLNDKGFLVVGLPEQLWQAQDVQGSLDAWTKSGKGDVLMMQRVSLLLRDVPRFAESESEGETDLLSFEENVSIAPQRVPNPRYSSTSSITPAANTESANPADRRAIKYLIALFRKT